MLSKKTHLICQQLWVGWMRQDHLNLCLSSLKRMVGTECREALLKGAAGDLRCHLLKYRTGHLKTSSQHSSIGKPGPRYPQVIVLFFRQFFSDLRLTRNTYSSETCDHLQTGILKVSACLSFYLLIEEEKTVWFMITQREPPLRKSLFEKKRIHEEKR